MQDPPGQKAFLSVWPTDTSPQMPSLLSGAEAATCKGYWVESSAMCFRRELTFSPGKPTLAQAPETCPTSGPTW
jgi:hypothetical protein